MLFSLVASLAACGDPMDVDAGPVGADAGADAGALDGGALDGGALDGSALDAGATECGDGVVAGDELCDGPDARCQELGAWFTGGIATCRPDCGGYDVASCERAPGRLWELITPAERDARWSAARCNDGTPFDLLYRPGAPGSDVWVVYLQGGGFGDDEAFPTAARPAQLTSTTALPDRSRGPLEALEHGIFGGPALNPDFHEAHFVLGHYCSSDLWSGRGLAQRPVDGVADGFWFAGRENVRALFEILRQRYGLDDADPDLRLLYGGGSAGNIGSAQTADLAARLLPETTADGRLRYLGDGAYVVAPPADRTDWAFGLSTLGDVALFERAIAYWDAEPLSSCPSVERGECYLGRGWYPGLVALGIPAIVAMSSMDEVILGLRGVCTEACGGPGRPCFDGCVAATTEEYAAIRASYRDDWADVGVEWLFAWGSVEHTAALIDDRWNGPAGAPEPLRGVVADFFFDRTAPRQIFANGADR